MRTAQRHRWMAWLTLSVILGVAFAAAVSRASISPGCQSVDTPIVESEQFTRYEDRHSHLPERPINPSSQEAMAVPPEARVASIDGLPLRWASVSGYGAVYQYFLGTDIDRDLTVSQFVAAGGIELDRDPVENPGESFAQYVLSALGERAVRVEIGDYTGALVWGDPNIYGIRPHSLSWSDGDYNYVLIADTSPERLVGLGRELVCGGGLGTQSVSGENPG